MGKEPTPLDIIPSKIATDVAVALVGPTSNGIAETAKDVWGGLVGDRVREWRQRNLVNSLEKTYEHLKQKGISPEQAQSLPTGDVYRIFEGASRAETTNLSEMWAHLIASAMDPKSNGKLDEALSKVLEQLTGQDAELFTLINSYEASLDKKDAAYQDEFEELTRKHKSAEALYDDGLISYREKEAIGEEIWKLNAALLRNLNHNLSKLATDLKETLATITDMQSSKENLQRLALIQPRGRELPLPELYFETDTNDAELLKQQYLQSIESLREWMHRIMERTIIHQDFLILDLGEGRKELNFKLSEFGKRFARACIGEAALDTSPAPDP
ncbi:Abi-alpha family protein [Celeribacter naphthalenivorans]|uniref:Abi-alpha family protein n=1 Tax=Celeribacter naphthalenivorans TaxID=1614694 RepID=UPI001CF9F478|nr:Abi-alpha family protein [Celeribacter naphthalenivorans]